MCLIILIWGIINDLVYAAGNTRSFGWMCFAFVLFPLGFAAAAYGPLILFTETYTTLMDPSSYGMAENYFDWALKLYGGPLVLVMVIINSAGAIAGSLLGRLLLSKHFTKAGLA